MVMVVVAVVAGGSNRSSDYYGSGIVGVVVVVVVVVTPAPAARDCHWYCYQHDDRQLRLPVTAARTITVPGLRVVGGEVAFYHRSATLTPRLRSLRSHRSRSGRSVCSSSGAAA